MPLTLWTEHGPGYRSDAFFRRITAVLTGDRPAVCIVPNRTWKSRMTTLCLPHCDGILFGDRIYTLDQWCESLATPSLALISPGRRTRILSHLLQTLPLEYYRSDRPEVTHAEVIAHGIGAALTAGISSKHLQTLARDFGQEREQDLATVMTAYLETLKTQGLMDAAQLPSLAVSALQQGRGRKTQRYIIDTGIRPIPLIWELLRALQTANPDADLHVIVPEAHRGHAETALGTAAQEISPEEWVATTGAQIEFYRTPHPTAQYQWMAGHLGQLLKEGMEPADIGVMPCNPDLTFWLEACEDAGLIPYAATHLPLSASPVSAPWHDLRLWDQAPRTAPLAEWTIWWKRQIAPDTRIRTLSDRIAEDPAASRCLRDLAAWEEVWRRCEAIVPSDCKLSQADLRTLAGPMVQERTPSLLTTDLYTDISFQSHLGDRLTRLLVLDATQDNLPHITSSSFFKLAIAFPQDPGAQILLSAFPPAETVLHLQLAVWQRLCGATDTITGIFSQGSDTQGDQFSSLFFDVPPQDVSGCRLLVASKNKPNSLQEASDAFLLTAPDTLAHVRQRMRGHTFSITELELFAHCPFSHFARYILGIDLPEEDTPEIPARDEGRLIHRLLELYYRNPADTSDAAADRLRGILSKEICTTTPLRQIQTDRLLALATAVIRRDCEEARRLGKDALHPAHLEWQFGYKDVPPLVLTDAAGNDIPIRGKVDRLDAHPARRRLLLLDYKHSTTKSVIGEIENGRHLQIPLYLMAAHRFFADHVILGGLLYDLPNLECRHGMVRRNEAQFLGIKGRPASLAKPETWDDLLETAAAHAVRYATQIREARLPLVSHTCDYCDWKDLLPWEAQH